MFESLTITGTLWYQFVDRTSSLAFVSGLYIIIIGSSVELIPSIFKKVVERPMPEINVPNAPHSDRYV